MSGQSNQAQTGRQLNIAKSATESSKVPNSVTWLRRRARYPSMTSVRMHETKLQRNPLAAPHHAKTIIVSTKPNRRKVMTFGMVNIRWFENGMQFPSKHSRFFLELVLSGGGSSVAGAG